MAFTPHTAFLIACAALAILASGARAQSAKLTYDIKRIKQTYQQTVERESGALKVKYLAVLKNLMEQKTRAGQLEEALAIKNETEEKPDKALSAKLPEDARQLKEKYQQAVKRVTEPLHERYLGELTKSVEISTRSGRLDDAKFYQNEINEDWANILFGIKWDWGGQFKMEFTAGGGGKGYNNHVQWKCTKPFVLEWTWDSASGTIEFEPDLSKGTVKQKNGDNSHVTFPLSRVKE